MPDNDTTTLLALGAAAVALFALFGRGDSYSFNLDVPENLGQPPAQTAGPGTSGSNQGDISSGTTPAEAQDIESHTSPGGDHEGPGTTAYEAGAEATTSTGGGPAQRTITSGGVTQDDDESDQVEGVNTDYEEAKDTLESTGGGAGGNRFTVG